MAASSSTCYCPAATTLLMTNNVNGKDSVETWRSRPIRKWPTRAFPVWRKRRVVSIGRNWNRWCSAGRFDVGATAEVMPERCLPCWNRTRVVASGKRETECDLSPAANGLSVGLPACPAARNSLPFPMRMGSTSERHHSDHRRVPLRSKDVIGDCGERLPIPCRRRDR